MFIKSEIMPLFYEISNNSLYGKYKIHSTKRKLRNYGKEKNGMPTDGKGLC